MCQKVPEAALTQFGIRSAECGIINHEPHEQPMIGGRLNATLFFREGAEKGARGGRAPQS